MPHFTHPELTEKEREFLETYRSLCFKYKDSVNCNLVHHLPSPNDCFYLDWHEYNINRKHEEAEQELGYSARGGIIVVRR